MYEQSTTGCQQDYCRKCSREGYKVWHSGECPNNTSNPRIGWVCPLCNTSNSPHQLQCPCILDRVFKIDEWKWWANEVTSDTSNSNNEFWDGMKITVS
tara:strand:+ start:618 stop:911 length:294 start_codon:yes stop_codon:yes gene_type:complete